MFYGLDRLSVDLDFDLLKEDQEDYVFNRVVTIVGKFGTLREAYKKRYNLFCLVSYEDAARNVKVEINRRAFGSRFTIKTYLGVSMQVMVAEDMFAHKLMAMYERYTRTSRDIYDVWFFLKNRFPINQSIVEQRAGIPFTELLSRCIDQLEAMDNRRILTGMGEFLTASQKDWAKVKLRSETIALLKLRLESVAG